MLAFIKVVKSCVYIQHFYFIAKAGTPYSMRVSGFLPLFNCRKRDYKAEDDKYQAISTFFLTFLLIFYAELFLLTEVISQPGLRQLQLNQISTNRRNAVFFCQILLVFVLYMLHNSDIVYQGGGCT